ncbi:MAG: hypothetical protein NC311_13200 [Muribaculaceae bacterium]|nr:hypothetical protein [Muribaculaceae bacterium]
MNKQYITAQELQTIMGISRGKAYEIIRGGNKELKGQGFITVARQLPIAYLEKKYYGFNADVIMGGVQRVTINEKTAPYEPTAIGSEQSLIYNCIIV